MIAKSDVIIPREYLIAASMSEDEMRVDVATHLYATKRLSMGKAKELAGLDLLSFQKELDDREICIHYSIEDLHEDMRNLGLEVKK